MWSLLAFTQTETSYENKKQRLDFAKTYFELGGIYSPSFNGKRILDHQISSFQNSAALNPYLTWGGFHFWGHGEFYVTIPLAQNNLEEKADSDYKLIHSVATGFRWYPWVYKKKGLRPYLGASWSALDFIQKTPKEGKQPTLSKNFLLVPDAGFLYGFGSFSLRLGINYFNNNNWEYPISKMVSEEINTPRYNIQIGLNYAFESSSNDQPEIVTKRNNYPLWSSPNYEAKRAGDFFIGIGPSSSFSLSKSKYNLANFPYLKNKLNSDSYFDLSVGYQFNKKGWFLAASFRTPKFKTEGYNSIQTIKKTSLAIEINKFLIDYSGFTPYLGINLSFDQIKYKEEVDLAVREFSFNSIEPGLTIGWDILPGKTEERIILRTNLRWYPFSSFEIDGLDFKFDQLEYNLIQVIFYPGRKKKK